MRKTEGDSSFGKTSETVPRIQERNRTGKRRSCLPVLRLIRPDLFSRDFLQRLYKEFPERLNGCYLKTFLRRMRAAECRAETYDIHARILAENDGTFEAGMVYLHDALFAVLLPCRLSSGG